MKKLIEKTINKSLHQFPTWLKWVARVVSFFNPSFLYATKKELKSQLPSTIFRVAQTQNISLERSICLSLTAEFLAKKSKIIGFKVLHEYAKKYEVDPLQLLCEYRKICDEVQSGNIEDVIKLLKG